MENLAYELLEADSQTDSAPDLDIVILGAGLSGIGIAGALRRAGYDNFTILEASSTLGGTWRDNIYPGVGVDVPSFSYQFSYARTGNWSSFYPRGSEVLGYLHDCVERFGIRDRIEFNRRVEEIAYDEHRGWWVLNGPGQRVTARYVIDAVGPLGTPVTPAIAGAEEFDGDVGHTARWDSELDIAGRHVAVIGTGASAVQLIPAIADTVGSLTIFQRTPAMVFPRLNPRIGRLARAAFTRLPITLSAACAVSDRYLDLLTMVSVHHAKAPAASRFMEFINRLWIRTQVRDRELRRKLAPRYGFFCKRPSVSNTYYRAFANPAVSLVADPIERITANGIRTSDGQHRNFDAIVYATGFLTTEKENTPPIPTYGRSRESLSEFWQQNRFQAFEGVSIPGFPNLFRAYGPYSLTGSFAASVEIQATHIIRVLDEARRRGAKVVEIAEDANRRNFETVMERQSKTVFMSGRCDGSNSYYFDERGDAAVFRPYTTLAAKRRARQFPLTNYTFTAVPRAEG